MRDRIWYNLQNAKFKSIYLTNVYKSAHAYSNLYSFLLAFVSTGSVAAWAIWKSFPAIWAGIVAVSQVLHIAKPYLPFLKNDRDFYEMAHQYEELYLTYEKLWFDYNRKRIDEDTAQDQLYNIKRRELHSSNRFKHICCPNLKSLIKKASEETEVELSRTFT